MQSKKVTFTVKVPKDLDFPDKELREVSLDVHTPDLEQVNKAQEAFNHGFDVAIRSKAPLRIEVEKLLSERGIWSNDKTDEVKKLNTELATKVNKLTAGGFKLTEAKKVALDIRVLRSKLATLNQERRILDGNTVEAQAETARFNWFVANCVVYTDTGKPFFANTEDYLNQANHEYAQEAARQFGVLQYGLDPDFEKKLPENKFLVKFKFVRDDLRLVNREGKLCDLEGNLIDEEGYKVDKDGNRLDYTGTPLNKEGEAMVDSKPYFDDQGNEITDEVAVATE